MSIRATRTNQSKVKTIANTSHGHLTLTDIPAHDSSITVAAVIKHVNVLFTDKFIKLETE